MHIVQDNDIIMARILQKKEIQSNNDNKRKGKSCQQEYNKKAKKNYKHDPGFNVSIGSDSSSSSGSSIFKF
jgi:hypothetical protein